MDPFQARLARVDRLPDDQFQLCDLTAAQATGLKKRLTDWAARSRNSRR